MTIRDNGNYIERSSLFPLYDYYRVEGSTKGILTKTKCSRADLALPIRNMYIYIYVCVCVCACICICFFCSGEGGGVEGV